MHSQPLVLWMTLLALATITVVAAPCWAEPPGPNMPSVAVTRIRTTESDDLADALGIVLRKQVSDMEGWSLDKSDESMEMMLLGLRCPWPPDATCEKRVADEMQVDRYIWGTIDERQGKAVGMLRLWQRGQVTTTADLSYPATLTDPDDTELQQIVWKALIILLGGTPKGTVILEVGDVDGNVYIGNEAVGQIRNGQATIVVPAGDQVIEVRAAGYQPLSKKVTIVAKRTVTLKLELEPTADSPYARFKWTKRKIIGVSLMGTGVAFAAGGLATQLTIWNYNKKNNDVAVARTYTSKGICDPDNFKENMSVYKKIQHICDKHKTYEVLQFVLYGVGAATFGTGLYLMLKDETPAASGQEQRAAVWRLRPMVAHDRGTVNVQLNF